LKSVQEAKAQLLNSYNLIFVHFNFINIEKPDFKELMQRYCNDRKKLKICSDELLKSQFMSLKSSLIKAMKIMFDEHDSNNDENKLLRL
jgi:predicted histidine transporter YuiF (NhaC family)